jgi:hypothetical protein
MAQDSNNSSPAQSGGWRRFQPDPNAPPPEAQGPNNEAQAPNNWGADGQGAQTAPAPYAPQGPKHLTIPAGTWITVRVNEPLSSDHNKPGDAFFATLAQPIIVNGLVIAHRGQGVSGMVSEAQKAGRVSGLSKLGLELTEVGLADGGQAQVKTRLMERHGDTSYGRDAAAIGTTVGTGAAIGAAVNGGVGAGVGAAAGVVASTIGVLLTRGTPTVVYPETALTFRLESPVTVSGPPDAFQPPTQQDYGQNATMRRPAPGPGYPRAPYGGAYYAPYPYPYAYGYPYFWGPTVVFRGGFRRW